MTQDLAIAAFKKQLLKQPIQSIAKESGKLIPFAGSAVAASVSAGMLEPPDGLWRSNWQKKLGTDISTDNTFSHAPDSFYFYNEKDDEYIDIFPPFC